MRPASLVAETHIAVVRRPAPRPSPQQRWRELPRSMQAHSRFRVVRR